MNPTRTALALAACAMATPALATEVTIDAYTFDLGQFANAAVTYRTNADGGHVAFDGKLWDNTVGVNNFTIGELAASQFGSDPGDQLSLNSRSSLGQGQDWFTLDFGAGGLAIGDSSHDTFVFYEITSATSGVDVEGTSWEISFNGGSFISAASGIATFLNFTSLGAENVNQVAFDLTGFGFAAGDILQSVTVRNLDTGSSTSDPDFIFGGLEGTLAVVPLPPAALAGLGMLAGFAGIRTLRRR